MRFYSFYLLMLVSFLLNSQSAADTTEIWSRLKASYRLKKNNVTGALDTLKPAEKLLSSASKNLQARVCLELGDDYILLGDNKNAEDYLNKGLALTSDKSLQGNLYSSLGNMYSKKGDLETAITMLLKSLKLYEESHATETDWGARQNLAICYAQTGKLKEAKKYFFEVLNTLSSKKGMEKSCADVSANIGVLYEMLNLKDSAMVMYRKAYSILEQYGNSSSMAMVINNMGVICIKQKKYHEGMDYMSRAKDIMLTSGDNTGAVLIMNNLADLLSGEGKVDEAFAYARLALRLADSLGNYDGIISSCQNLHSLSAKKKDYKSAYEYCRRAYLLSDSIKGLEKLKNIAEMESKYETEKKQKEIELLSKTNELHEAQIEKEKNFRYFIIGFSGLVLVIALLLFYNLRNKQKTNAELNLRNQKIEQAYQVIEEKQKEILDSIHYAKRIQLSLLPSEKMIDRKMNEQQNQKSSS